VGKDPKEHKPDQVRKDSGERKSGYGYDEKPKKNIQEVTDWDKAPRPNRDKDDKKG
jgi:hypothetical protein